MTAVSVVVPVRDRAELLESCLRSLVPQLDAVDGEVVVVDDGSTDGSLTVARRWAGHGPVRVLESGGLGAVAARALGVSAARGALIAFTDSDCVPSPGWLRAGCAAIEDGADLVQGRTTPTRACGLLERSVWVTSEDGLYATCNLFVRRAVFDSVGGFDRQAGERLHFRAGTLAGLGFGEDTLLGWRIRRSGHRTAFCAEAHVGHHVFAFDWRDHLRRAWQAGGFAGLIREVPELRDAFLVDRVFLGTRRRVLVYLALPALLAGRRRIAGSLVGWWLGTHVLTALGRERTTRRRAAAVVAGGSADLVTGAALVAGSVRTRSVVL